MKMKWFWVAATLGVCAFTAYVVGRNLLHAWKIRTQISVLEEERDLYRARIERDSALIDELRYDDRLEQFARERYRMQRAGEVVYVSDEL